MRQSILTGLLFMVLVLTPGIASTQQVDTVRTDFQSFSYDGIIVETYRIAYSLTESRGRKPCTGSVYVISTDKGKYVLLTVGDTQLMINILNTFVHKEGTTYSLEPMICRYENAEPVIDNSSKITISEHGMTVQSCHEIVIFLWWKP